METIPEQTSGPLETTSNGLLVVPPLHAMPRSKTGRKPQRSSPLAGPAVLVSDAEDNNLLVVPSSPIQGRGSNSLPSPTLRPRPKSMMSDYSTLSLHPQTLIPRSRLHAPGTKQIIRPISSAFPFGATQEHFSHPTSICSSTTGEFRNLGEQSQNSGYAFPSTRTSNRHVLPTTRRPTSFDEKPIDVPEIPPPARSTSRMTGTLPRDNSWYIANAYDDTPRFSRLGLAADDVILPVSAKEYKKYQQQRDSGGSLAEGSSGDKRSSLIGCTLASTLKLARSFTSTSSSSDHRLAQEPSTPSTSDHSSHTSTTPPESDSLPAMSATSSSLPTPHPSLSRTRTSSFTNSSSSSYTCFTPDIVPSSSRTSIDEETAQISSPTIVHRRDLQQEGQVSGKDRSKHLFAAMTKRRTTGDLDPSLRFNQEKRSIKSGVSSPVVDKDEKKMRRGGTLKRFLRLFVPS